MSTARTVAEICGIAELGDEAQVLLRNDMPPRECIAVLVEKQLYPEAVRFLAHCLPKRESVWWAWFCARRASGPAPPPKIKASLDATERWIAQPNEENRRQAMQMGEEAQLGTAAGCAGLAAFFSAGSLGPPEAPPIPPGEFLTAKAVAGSIVFAAVGAEPERAPEKFRGFIEQGLDVARRIRIWEAK